MELYVSVSVHVQLTTSACGRRTERRSTHPKQRHRGGGLDRGGDEVEKGRLEAKFIGDQQGSATGQDGDGGDQSKIVTPGLGPSGRNIQRFHCLPGTTKK